MKRNRSLRESAHGRSRWTGPDAAGVTFDISNNAQIDVLASVADFDAEMRAVARRVDGLAEMVDRLADINPTWALLVAKRGRPWARRLLAGLLARTRVPLGER